MHSIPHADFDRSSLHRWVQAKQLKVSINSLQVMDNHFVQRQTARSERQRLGFHQVSAALLEEDGRVVYESNHGPSAVTKGRRRVSVAS